MILLKENPILYRSTVDSVLRRMAAANSASAGWWWIDVVSDEDISDEDIAIPKRFAVAAAFAFVALAAVAAFVSFKSFHRKDSVNGNANNDAAIADNNAEQQRKKDLRIKELQRENHAARRTIVRLSSDLIALDNELLRVLGAAPLLPSGTTIYSDLAGRYAKGNDDAEDTGVMATVIATATEEAGGTNNGRRGSCSSNGSARLRRGSLEGFVSQKRRSTTTVEDGEWDFGLS